MCRSHADGGRLCPSQTDPVLIANRNARRRAAYAKKKHGATTPHTPSIVEHAALGFDKDFYGNFKSLSKKALYAPLGQEKISNFGISSNVYEGYLVDNNYLDAIQVKGKIDYSKLDEESYKEFGFQEPSETRKNALFIDELRALSSGEVDKMTQGEKTALQAYTSNAYTWINGALYGSSPALRPPMPSDEEENKIYFPDSDEKAPRFKPTPNCLKQVTDKIDSAMRKNVGEQKTIYRGIKFNHSTFGKYDGEEEVENRVSNFAAENYPLGQELKFDGYQSASYSPIVASEYSSSHGLVFEIKTASGVNVTDISVFNSEREAILPRDARYMVVGVHNNVAYKTADADISLNPTQRNNVTVVQLIEINEQGYVKNEENQFVPPALTDEQLETKELPDFLKSKFNK